MQRVLCALEILLWVAVCACENKMQHIQIIFQMEDEVAAELKQVVQEQQAIVQALNSISSPLEIVGSEPEVDPPVATTATPCTERLSDARVTELLQELAASRDRLGFIVLHLFSV